MKLEKKFKKILITGAAGFIGSHLAESLFLKYPNSKFILFDKLTYAANIKFISKLIKDKNIKFIKADLLNLKILKKSLKNVDLAINVAAESHVDNSFGNSIAFTKTNTLGAHTFFEACRYNKLKKIIHISTDEVYGENIGKAFSERRFLNPTNPYSASKAGADMIANSYIYSYKLPIIIVRANNIFGKRQFPEKLISKTIFSFLKKIKMTIQGDGDYYRYFLSVEDFCEGIKVIIDKGKTGDIFNIASNKEYKITKVVEKICEIFKIDFKNNIKFITNRPFNDKSYNISCKKISLLGWKPKKELFDELPEICEWYKKNVSLFKIKKI